MKIAEYTFNNGDNVLPTFNSGYTYDYTDVDNGDGTITRTITSDILPTRIKFDTTGENVTEIIYLNMSEVNRLSEMFYGCQLLTKVPENISDWGIPQAGATYSMFDGCYKLCNNQLIMDNWVITDPDLTGTVKGTLVETISVNNWDFTNKANGDVYASSLMKNNSRLKEVNMENWDVSQLAYFCFDGAFQDCVSLKQVNMKGLTFGNNEDIYLTTTKNNELITPFTNCPLLDYIDLQDADISAINGIISVLPDRTMDSMGLLNIAGVDDASQVDEATANSKYWLISLAKTTVNNTCIGGINISELFIGPAGVKQVYLGDILIYENKNVVNDKIIMFNENINTLFILGDGLLQYDEQNLNLTISDDINVIYDEEESNLTIGGEE